MVFLKLAALIILVWLIARGFTISDAKKVNRLNAEIERMQASAQELYDLAQNEKKILVTTIEELREEISGLKKERQELLREYWRIK